MRRELRVAPFLLAAVLAACGTTSSSSRSEQSKSKSEKASAAEINVKLGESYMRQGKLEIAKDKLDKALELDPKLTDAHTVIAVLYEQINDPAAAERHYKRAAELEPKNGDVNNNYGTFLCRLGQYERADHHYARALQDPFYATPAVALTNRGTCAQKWGKHDLAEESFRHALQISPNQPEALLALAEILYQKGDFFRARAFVQRHDTGGKAGPNALLLAMKIEEALGDRRAVRDYRTRLLEQFPESEQAQNLKNAEQTRR
jgi:type IV pilus assembly protein PilF